MHKNRSITAERNDLQVNEGPYFSGDKWTTELESGGKSCTGLIALNENVKYLAETSFFIFAGNPDHSLKLS